jgi:hypothetical protein
MPALVQPSLSSGEISPKLHARVDLARYQTALKLLRNCIVLPEGGVTNRAGTRFVSDVGEPFVLIPFVYNTEQTYMLVFAAGEIRVFADGGFVQHLGTDVVVANPYTVADLDMLRFTQSEDVLTVTHKDYAPREFRRLTSTTFEFVVATHDEGPFIPLNSNESIVVTASAREGTVTIEATGNIFDPAHVGALFYIEQSNLAEIPPWESNKKLVGATGNPLGLKRRSDGKTFRCTTSQVATASHEIWTGTVRPTHERDGNALAGGVLVERAGVAWEYRDSGYGILRITTFVNAGEVLATVLRALPDACVGGITVLNTFPDTGDGATLDFAIGGATTQDKTKWQVLLDGVIQPTTSFEIDLTNEVLSFYTAPGLGVAVVMRELSISNQTDVWAFGAWSEYQGYPSVVTYWQDRLVFAASRRQPKTVWGSKSGQYPDFGVSVPSVDDDALDFTLNARQQNAIVDLLPLDNLIALTSAGAWKVTDGQNQVLTPSTVGFKPQSFRGAAAKRAVILGEEAIYAHVSGRKLRTLGYALENDKFSGINLNALASHLFSRTKTILDFDFSEEPHSQLWVTRSDGRLIGLTYEREQQTIGFGRHDTKNGYFVRVCSIPEGGENAVYFYVRRTIGGQTKHYLERLAERDFDDLVDAMFVDCALTYDGRNETSKTMTLSGSGWTVDDELDLVASAATFSASSVGDEIWLHIDTESQDEIGEPMTLRVTVRLEIFEYTSTTAVRVRPLIDVPEEFQGVQFTNWTFAHDSFSGADHLEGEECSVLADGEHRGYVTIVDGGFSISPPGGVVHLGKQMIAEGETLDANVVGEVTIRHRSKTIPKVHLDVLETRGVMAGPDRDHLEEVAERSQQDYEPGELVTGILSYGIPARHNTNGVIVFRQDKPLPMTIRAIIPDVEVGESN